MFLKEFTQVQATFLKAKLMKYNLVRHKLLKQVFAIAKSGLIYDGNYKSILVKN
ncbi:hypothetical protein SAMN04489796_105143 [Winogradskyella thalassocola]|uniref:Uncharacterized protein n=1 Tax=Winogradskyella thalassocola TaxID=262004 RepID=A0A1G8G9W5_9FLAO|nr:hypothetical protein SAMN04489796_105143 [Winogradskyella thalassocola]